MATKKIKEKDLKVTEKEIQVAVQTAKTPVTLDSITIDNLTPENQKKTKDIVKSIDLKDTQGLLTFGAGAQSKVSQFAGETLMQVKSKDTGVVGDQLTDLMIKIKDLDIDGLEPGTFASRLPFVGGMFNKARRFLAQYDTLAEQIEKIVDELDAAKIQMFKDIALLDQLYEKNNEHIDNIELYIVAGRQKLQWAHDELLPELKEKADKTGDPVDAQAYNDMRRIVGNFEKKLHDLLLTRTIAIQTAPQIRIIQYNNEILADKIQSSILNTIPIWKQQVVLAVTLLRQQKALKAQREVTDTTNELLQKNSDMLKQQSIATAKEAERGIVDIETLKKTHNDLLTVIEETLRIQEEGKAKRLEAEKELNALEVDLKKKLTATKKV